MPSRTRTTQTDNFNVKDCQEELIAFYLTEMDIIQVLPWMPEEAKNMENIFVKLELMEKETSRCSAKNMKLENNEDLVMLKTSQGQRVNRVLIQGEAGSGKSTLAANMAYKWALGKAQSQLSQFSLVFMISMHEIQDSNASLEDIIFQQILPEDSKVSKDGLKSYITDHAKQVLLLVDGLDEDSSGALRNESSEITKILQNRQLCECCVILTTRPHRVTDIGEYQKHYTQIKLVGFSWENIKIYICKFLPDEDQRIQLGAKIAQTPHLITMATTPVLLLIICLLWQDQCILPDTKTQLYQQTIKYIWKRYQIREGQDPLSDDESNDNKFGEDLSMLLNGLGKVALKETLGKYKKVVFNEKDLASEIFKLGCHAGLMTKERLRSKLNVKTSVTFLHKSFQDFCAGVYLANLLDTNQIYFDDYLKDCFESGHLYSVYPDLLDFCCGTNPKTIHGIVFHFTNAVSKNKYAASTDEPLSIDIAIHLSHIYESQLSYKECLKLVPLYSKITYVALNVYPREIPVMRYLWNLWASEPSHSPERNFFSILKCLKISIPFTYPLQLFLKYTTNLCRLDMHFISAPQIETTTINAFFRVLGSLHNLKNLHLYKDGYPYDIDITNLLHILQSTDNRNRFLTVTFCGFQFDCKTMAAFLDSNHLLVDLLLVTKFGQFPTTQEILRIFPHLKHLDSLSLIAFKVGSAVKHLRPIVSQLKHLNLQMTELDENHLWELFSFLKRAQKLTYLSHSGNTLSVSSMEALVRCLKYIPHLKELHLFHTFLNDTAVQILASGLRDLPGIHIVDVAENPDISSKGKDALNKLPGRNIIWNLMNLHPI